MIVPEIVKISKKTFVLHGIYIIEPKRSAIEKPELTGISAGPVISRIFPQCRITPALLSGHALFCTGTNANGSSAMGMRGWTAVVRIPGEAC